MSTTGTARRLELTADPVALTAALVDIESVSGNEATLADAVQAALSGLGTFSVDRDGDAVVARTNLGRPSRVVLAGHLDTVPVADNLPSRLSDGILHGLGTCDMKSGVAVMLHVAATLPDPAYDLTLICYDNEEVESELNGIGRLSSNHPDWLDGDFAILLEPSNAAVEAGCQGTLRMDVTVTGRRAHSARSWMGSNAIHALAPVLARLVEYEPRTVDIDGCTYREGLNAVRIDGGVAGNVIPDAGSVEVNFRFAPDRSDADAVAHVREVLDGYDCRLVDLAGGALPGLSHPTAAAFVTAVGGTPRAKLGWTDVSRFAALGLPAVNFGPGDPNVAHSREEHVPVGQIVDATAALRRYLSSPPA